MLNIKEISEMENVMQQLADKINSYPYVVFYGLGFSLKLVWDNYLEWFGRPAAIIDRAVKTGEKYDGIPLYATVSELPQDILKNCVVLITPPCSREEICADLEKYIERERIVKYPGLLVYNSKSFRDFIREHEETIREFYDTLADEESRVTFENWLKGKVTCDISWFCRSCIPNPYVNIQQFPMEMFYEKGYNSDLYFKKELGRQVPYDSLFCTGVCDWSDHEVYFDCGAAYGDTYLGFVSAVKGRYQNIVLLEPEERAYEELERLVGDAPGVKCIMSGVSDKNTEIYTSANAQLGGVIVGGTAEETEGEKIALRTIDSVSEELKLTPTLIKMDIEGAELSALKGAEQTIRTAKPKLAVCIYHKDEDLIEIPQYLHSLNPDYKMYVRHFDCSPCELVLFCM